MNYLTLKQELAAQLGLDETDSSQNTLLGRWLNTSQRLITQYCEWPFLRAQNPLILTTVTDYTTGTCSVSADSTTVTFSATIADSKANQYIQFAGSNDWYLITAHTAGTDTATIDPASISDQASVSYTIRKFNYSCSSSVDRILQIRQNITPYQLREESKENFDFVRPNPETSGTPRVYMMTGEDSDGNWQFRLWPTPDSEHLLYIDYLKRVSDMSSDTDTPVIPEKYHGSTLMEGAKWQGYDFLDDTRSTESKKFFLQLLQDMKMNMEDSVRLIRMLKPVDTFVAQVELPYPEYYPNK